MTYNEPIHYQFVMDDDEKNFVGTDRTRAWMLRAVSPQRVGCVVGLLGALGRALGGGLGLVSTDD